MSFLSCKNGPSGGSASEYDYMGTVNGNDANSYVSLFPTNSVDSFSMVYNNSSGVNKTITKGDLTVTFRKSGGWYISFNKNLSEVKFVSSISTQGTSTITNYVANTSLYSGNYTGIPQSVFYIKV